MEVDGLEDTDVALDLERILTDEQVLERLEAVHRVARADADDPLIGLDADDGDRELGAWDRIPGSRERRVERNAEALETDGADPHRASIADRLRSSPRRRRLRTAVP
jgi:hypothetical protein